MNLIVTTVRRLLQRLVYTLFFMVLAAPVLAQKSKADSLQRLLEKEKTDTGKVYLMWNIADALNRFNPDSAIQVAQQGYYFAQKLNDTEGESRSLGIMANSFSKIGNYTRSLELNIQKLKLEEKRNKPRNLASVLMNIGIVYVYQEEFRLALTYYFKADSVINKFDVKDLKFSILLNMGDVYDRMDSSAFARSYFYKSLEYALANDLPDQKIGLAMTGLGNSYRKLGEFSKSLTSYHTGNQYLLAANDDETYCEATLGLAKLYQSMKNQDSSVYYAKRSLSVAEKDNLIPLQLEAAKFLARLYKERSDIENAYVYINQVQNINDTLNSKSRVRQLQVLSSEEQFRQRELAERKRISDAERSSRLQLLLIAIFIPGLFLITILLSRIKLHLQAIRLLGVLTLLFFFEYLTLLLHPTVAKMTNHTPVFEILIFVGIAAILLPAHHRLEHWLIHKLIHHRIHHPQLQTDAAKTTAKNKKKSPS